jgi:N utilization substance protein B
MVAESVTNWEKERLFSTDVVLIVMGAAEAVTFPSIPVKVSINEYVEISKFYGTPKSRSFVNGLLDRIVQKLAEDGRINKSGKGLL